MRIVSWNIHGAPAGASRRQLQRAWHHLAALDADLILLQEIREAALPDWLSDEWVLLRGEVGQHGKTAAWGSAIAAKPHLNLRPREDLLDDGTWLDLLYGYVVIGEIDLAAATPCLVSSVHAPAVPATKMLEYLGRPGAIPDSELDAIRIEPDPPWSTDVVFHALRRIQGERFIFGGDWNLARLFDWNKRVPTNALFFSRALQNRLN